MTVNALADEPSFHSSGLPRAPKSAPFHDHSPVRSFRHENGRYYYFPAPGEWGAGPSTRREPAVEKLRKSADAAEAVCKGSKTNVDTGGIVICNGTSALGMAELEAKRRNKDKEQMKASASPTGITVTSNIPQSDRGCNARQTEPNVTTAQAGADLRLSEFVDDSRRNSTSGLTSRFQFSQSNDAALKRHSAEIGLAPRYTAPEGQRWNLVPANRLEVEPAVRPSHPHTPPSV